MYFVLVFVIANEKIPCSYLPIQNEVFAIRLFLRMRKRFSAVLLKIAKLLCFSGKTNATASGKLV